MEGREGGGDGRGGREGLLWAVRCPGGGAIAALVGWCQCCWGLWCWWGQAAGGVMELLGAVGLWWKGAAVECERAESTTHNSSQEL